MHTGMVVNFRFNGGVYKGEIVMVSECMGCTRLWMQSKELESIVEITSMDVVDIHEWRD